MVPHDGPERDSHPLVVPHDVDHLLHELMTVSRGSFVMEDVAKEDHSIYLATLRLISDPDEHLDDVVRVAVGCIDRSLV